MKRVHREAYREVYLQEGYLPREARRHIYHPGYTLGCTREAYIPPRVYLRVYKGGMRGSREPLLTLFPGKERLSGAF